MKIKMKVSQSAGFFGGGPTVEVKVEATADEGGMAAAITTTLMEQVGVRPDPETAPDDAEEKEAPAKDAPAKDAPDNPDDETDW